MVCHDVEIASSFTDTTQLAPISTSEMVYHLTKNNPANSIDYLWWCVTVTLYKVIGLSK